MPAIAASWTGEPRPDASWDFTLRPGAKFANGRAITSADVKYTLERIARKGSSSPAAAQLDAVAGFKAFNVEGKAEEPGRGHHARRPTVVRIELDQPLASLPAILGNPAFGIVPREAVEAPSRPASPSSRWAAGRS